MRGRLVGEATSNVFKRRISAVCLVGGDAETVQHSDVKGCMSGHGYFCSLG